MAVTLPGQRSTNSFTSPDERPKNYRETLLRLVPDTKARLTAITGLLSEEATNDPEFKIFEKEPPAQYVTLAAAATNSDTTLTLVTGDAKWVRSGYILRNASTQEIVFVSQDPASPYDSINVVRGDNLGSTAAAMSAGDKLIIVATSHEEGDTAPKAINQSPTVVTNYTQIFRNTLKLTGTAMKTALRYAPGGPLKEAKRDVLEMHMIELEKAFLFGVPYEDLSGSEPRRTTGGFLHFVNTNVFDFAGTVTTSAWNDAMKDLFKYGSSTKLALVGNQALVVLHDMIMNNSNMNITPDTTVWGLNVGRLITPFGELIVKQHPLLSEAPGYEDWGVVVDTKYIKYRYMRGRDTHYRDNIQPNDADAYMGEYLTEAGLELQLEKVHGVFQNMTAYSD